MDGAAGKAPILDTNVLIDIFVGTRPRHEKARELGKYLLENQVPVRVPVFSLFEIHAALRQVGPWRAGTDAPTEETPLLMETVDVTQAFFEAYFDPELPYSKAGDLLLLSMAKKEGRPLVTEDDKLYAKAREAGLDVFRIDEYIDHLRKLPGTIT